MKRISSKNLGKWLTTFVLAGVCAVAAVFGISLNSNNSTTTADAYTSSTLPSGTSYYSNFYNKSTGKFDATGLNKLAELAGYDSMGLMLADKDNVGDNYLYGWRFDVVLGIGSYTFGGSTYELKWTPMYVSTASNGDLIMTLMLASTETKNGTVSNQEISTFSDGTYNGSTSDTYSYYYNQSYYDCYASTYATSYIRNIILQQGTTYATFKTGTKVTKPSNLVKFSDFVGAGALVDYIVVPGQVSWQMNENGNNAPLYVSTDGTYSKVDGCYQESLNDLGNTWQTSHYPKSWSGDTLWLPSYTEASRDDSPTPWYPSSKQLSNNTDDSVTGYWVRTANEGNNYEYGLRKDGTLNGGGGTCLVTVSNAVRPCFHLNLSLAAKSAGIKTEVSEPEATDFTYNGKSITRTDFSGQSWYNSKFHGNSSIIGIVFKQNDRTVTSPVSAGEYDVTFSFKDTDTYAWTDGTSDPKTITMTINPLTTTIPKISYDENSCIYNGTSISFNISNISTSLVDVTPPNGMESFGAKLSATNAGTYTVEFNLNDPVNYTWTDGKTETKYATVTIKKQDIDFSKVNDLEVTYRGSAYTISDFSNEDWYNEETYGDPDVIAVTFKQNGSAVKAQNAGTYNAVFILKDTNNYEWLHDMGENSVVLTIKAKPLDVDLSNGTDSTLDSNEINGDDKPVLKYKYTAEDGTEYVDTKPTKPGTYTVTIYIDDPTGNYALSDEALSESTTYVVEDTSADDTNTTDNSSATTNNGSTSNNGTSNASENGGNTANSDDSTNGSDNTSDVGGIGGDTGLSVGNSNDVPVWQLVVAIISIIVGIGAYVGTVLNIRAANRSNKRAEKSGKKASVSTAGLALLALWGMANSGWTALALLLLAWCIIGLIAWGISFHKRELARENLEDSKHTTTHIVLNGAAATASANGTRPATVTTKQTNAQGHVVYVTTASAKPTTSTKGVSASGKSDDGFNDNVTVVKK